jgi:hypothetical protein
LYNIKFNIKKYSYLRQLIKIIEDIIISKIFNFFQ